MTHSNIHTNLWQLGRKSATSIGYCFSTINNVQDKPRHRPGLDIDTGA